MGDTITKGALLDIEGLVYAYEDGTRALDGVSLRVERGESVGIVGPNGAGKSTLILHLNGFLRGEGKVLVFGMEASKATLREIRRRVGIVFQDPEDQLFMPTVFDDVAFGPINLGLSPDEVMERVGNALAKVGMTGFEERAPHHLSAGEKHSVAIATVLSMSPDILVMDEPTASLDPRSRRQLIELLRGLDIAKLIASHDLEMILETCVRVVVVDEGKTIATGPTAEILGDEDLMLAHGLETPYSLRMMRD